MTSTILDVALKVEGRTSTLASEKSRANCSAAFINRRVAHGQIVQGAMLVRSSGIVRHLHDAVEDLLGGRRELRRRDLLRLRNGFDERVAPEAVDLVEGDDRYASGRCTARRCGRSAQADDDVDVVGAGDRPDGSVEVDQVARLQDISVEALNREHPAQLTDQIAVLGPRNDLMEDLWIGLSGRLGALRGLGEFLLDAQPRKACLDLASA